MYFVRDYVVRTATSSNQLDWFETNTVALSSTTPSVLGTTAPITGCSVLPTNAGTYMMAYSVGVGTGPFGIFMATSTDGSSFGVPSISTVIYISTGANFTGSPKLLELTNGNWRLYYAQDIVIGNPLRGVYTSLSSDEGVSWSTPTLISNTYEGVTISTLTKQNVRLFVTGPPDSSTTTASVLYSALSPAGVSDSFFDESGVRLTTSTSDGSISNPVVIRSSSTDSFRYRVFYNFTAAQSTIPASIFSAVTSTPDPQVASPSEVTNAASATTIQITGEIFSSTPTVKLSLAGQSDIIGTSVSRVNDQTISFQVDPSGAALGAWDVVVTNEDGVSGTLTGGFTVTFPSGNVVLTDNLLRPRENKPANVTVTIFVDGTVAIRIYTIDGQLVRTLYDGNASAGPLTKSWDATNDQGRGVASGVYVVKVTGPKVDDMKKIVVIR